MNSIVVRAAAGRIAMGFLACLVLIAGTAWAKQEERLLVPADQPAPMGATLIHDYGSFALYRTTADQASQLAFSGSAKGYLSGASMDWIQIDAAPFRGGYGAPDIPSDFRADYGDEPALHLVQFIGPIHPDWFSRLEATGAQPVHYIHSNAYLVWADGRTRQQLDAEAATRDMLQVSEPFHPWMKMGPMLRERTARADWSDRVEVTVQIYRHPDFARNRDQLMAWSSAQIRPPDDVLEYQNLTMAMRLDEALEAARMPEVTWVEIHVEPELYDEVQTQIMAGQLTGDGSSPTGPGYLNWLLDLGFSDDPADYPIIDITDDGLGNGGTAAGAGDDTLTQERDGVTSRVIFNQSCHGSTGSGAGPDGHGHINASIAAGYDLRSGFPYRDGNGYQRGLGVNPFGRVGSTRIFAPGFSTGGCGGNAGLIAANHSAGARISNNSWGCASCAGSYNTDSQLWDQAVRDARTDLPGNQQMIYVFAAGNSGSSAGTVGTPGNGKNMITVGASENVRPTWTDGCGVGPAGADNAMDVIGFSSRGPAPGGRVKPEVIAPGTHIQGTASTASGYDGSGVCDQYQPGSQTIFAASSGTSHSSPAVAGLASLVWWWLEDLHGLTPSPAMVKAYLMAHPTYLTGTGANDTLPSNTQGFGMPNMELAFDDATRLLHDQGHLFTGTGQTWTQEFQVGDPTRPLRVTMAYTDAPGMTGTSPQVNRLRLRVEINGQTYLGNVFSGQWSTTGGSPDTANNYAAVFLPPGTGSFGTITVEATSISGDGVPGNGIALDQDFALVCYNCTEDEGFALQSAETAAQICAGDDAEFTVSALSIGGFDQPVMLADDGLPAGLSASFAVNPVIPASPATSSLLTVSNTGSLSSGSYPFQVLGTSPGVGFDPSAHSLSLSIDVATAVPGAPLLSSPANGASTLSTTPSFSWTPVSGAASYVLEISETPGFGSLVHSVEVAGTSYELPFSLDPGTEYYWRVSAINGCGAGLSSAPFSFTTAELICRTPGLPIPDNSAAGINDDMAVTTSGELVDLEVYLDATHTWVGDLRFELTHLESGTSVVLVNRPGVGGGSFFGCGGSDYDVWLSDGAASSVQTACASPPPAIAGVLQPFQPLAGFAGVDLAGTWRLNVSDRAPGDTGTLNEWCLLPVVAAPEPSPVAEVIPASLDVVVAQDDSDDFLLEISNAAGTAPLVWSLDQAYPALAERHDVGAYLPVGISRDRARGEPIDAASNPVLAAPRHGHLTGDWSEDFESVASLPAAGWSLINNSPSPGNSWFQGSTGVFGPHSGSGYAGANFESISTGTGTISNWLITPEMSLQNDTEIRFWTRTPAGSTWPDRLEVRMSTAGSSTEVGSTPISVGDFTNLLLTINPDLNQGGYPEVWTEFVIELSGLPPTGETGRLAFRYFVTNSGPTGSNGNYIGIDTLSVTQPEPAGCQNPEDVPWLGVAPDMGTLAAGDAEDVIVTIETFGLAEGNYQVLLCLASNDPVNPLIEIPVDLEVGPPVGPIEADVILEDLVQTYTGSPLGVTVTTVPPGLSVEVTYDGSATLPTDVGSYPVVATITEPGYEGSAGDTFVIEPAAATLSLGNLAQTFDGDPKPVTVTSDPPGVAYAVTYDGLPDAPSAVGSYPVVATITDSNYTGPDAEGTLVISEATATVILDDLIQTYTGSPLGVTVTTVPPGLSVEVTYDGSATLPTDAGSYPVVATITEPGYEGSASDTFVIEPAAATLSLDNLAQTFDGDPKPVTVTSDPPGVSFSVTYDGLPDAPSAVGSYPVVATITDPNYTGPDATGTLVISEATATVTLGDLVQTYTGSPLSVSVSTDPPGLSFEVTYDGLTTAPTDAGSYAVVATITEPGYEGSASGTFEIEPAAATLSLDNLAQTFDGDPKPVTVTSTPPGVAFSVTYDGDSVAPSAVGSYAVVATITDPNYTGPDAEGTLVISAVGELLMMPTWLNLGEVDIGQSVTSDFVVIENEGQGPLDLGMLTLEGLHPADYGLVEDTCSAQSLPSTDFCGFRVEFSPLAPGVREARVRVPSNDPDGPHYLELIGTHDVIFHDGFELP